MSSDVKWIKIVTDIFDDEKMYAIESLPDGMQIEIVWFKILCLAGKCNRLSAWWTLQTSRQWIYISSRNLIRRSTNATGSCMADCHLVELYWLLENQERENRRMQVKL